MQEWSKLTFIRFFCLKIKNGNWVSKEKDSLGKLLLVVLKITQQISGIL